MTATVTKIVDGIEVSSTPHMAFPEGNRIAAELIDIAAPLIKFGGSKFTTSDGEGGRKPIALQEVMARLPVGREPSPADYAFLADVLSGLSMDEIVSALVDAIKRLFLTDAARAERLFLAILSNTVVAVPAAAGGFQRLPLGTAEAFRSIVGTSYRRQFALLAFALRVSFQDFFGGASRGGSPATSPG